MFCFNCGAGLIANAKFCSGCGTAVQQVSQHLEKTPLNETTVNIPKPQHNNEIFMLLGYEVVIPKVTKDYISIRNEFQQLANDAMDRITRNFDTKYRSLDDLIRYADNDVDELFVSALEHAIDVLKSRGIYNINMSRFFDVASNYGGYWEENFSDIRERFKELVEYKEAKKDYRSGRKDSRGRMIGGGFGVGGAVKGMAMAGTANMATGLLHSFTNALGNAATSAEVSSMKSKIFKDPETKKTLCLSVYYDIFYLHRAIIDCINDSSLSLVAQSYTSGRRDEAVIIFNNIMNGSVRAEDRGRMIVDILMKDPFDIDYFELALEYTSYDLNDGLIDYARYFMIPIDQLIQSHEEDIRNTELLAQQFGEHTLNLEYKLQNNSVFHAFRQELSEDPPRAIQKALFSIQSESIRTNVFLVPGDLSDKLKKKLENVKATYAPIVDEKPIVLFDNTSFGSAKDGFLITDQRIYVHNMMDKGWSSSFQEIEKMGLSGSTILINGKSLDITMISGKDREDFYEFVELLVFVQKYGGTIGASNGSIDHSHASNEIQSMKLEVASSSNTTSEIVMNKDNAIEEIKNMVLGIKNPGVRKYVFIENENEKVNKKFRNALETYAKLESDEIPIVLYDNTGFGSAKDGCLITNRRVYIHNMLQKPIKIDIKDIISVEVKGSDLLINQHPLYITMISSPDRAEFKAYIGNFIHRLK